MNELKQLIGSVAYVVESFVDVFPDGRVFLKQRAAPAH
jgi:hypothetical protein